MLLNKKQLFFRSKRPNVTTSIFAIMSKMATKNNALNWVQGLLNFAMDEKLTAIVAEVCFYKKGLIMNCLQKVRHYLGIFLWKYKSSMIVHLSLNV